MADVVILHIQPEMALAPFHFITDEVISLWRMEKKYCKGESV